MTTNNKKPNKAGNTNATGGSYKEKQPMAKPKKGKADEMPVDEDGDGKPEHSMDSKQKKTKTST